ncbi:universal stress protein UspA [Sulfurifustis variabilis]|uniref:Universal stress protein n=1 Tax=Sulfurifustis variabilis TaxID=1675686 RepID=A0A1B4V498_9GAMM|nr:universal stress protein [Sulfurifustis variabilis]BAU48346.1 universal stress protein UspA [Sulfurifustis variabilis]
MYKRILVPVDGSSASLNGLDEAVRLAKTGGAALRVLHVVDGIAFVGEHSAFTADAESFRRSGKKMMDDVMSRVRKQPVRADSLIVENLTGRAADSIVKEARKWRADLIVMGTHGRRGFNRFVFGSDAELVVRTAQVPVLLVRGRARSTKAGARRKKKSR